VPIIYYFGYKMHALFNLKSLILRGDSFEF